MQIESSKEIYKLLGGNEFFSEYIKAYSFGENSYDGWATFMFDGCETCNLPLERVYSNVTAVFNGTGFYSTDNRK